MMALVVHSSEEVEKRERGVRQRDGAKRRGERRDQERVSHERKRMKGI